MVTKKVRVKLDENNQYREADVGADATNIFVSYLDDGEEEKKIYDLQTLIDEDKIGGAIYWTDVF